MFKKIKDKPWYPLATAICIGVVLYIILSNFTGISNGVKTFFGYFSTVILGGVLAYIINPLVRFFAKLFKGIKDENKIKILSIVCAYLVVVAFLIFAVAILIPQLISSIETFADNIDSYVTLLDRMLNELGISSVIDISGFISSTENIIITTISEFITNNSDKIINGVTSTGKSVFSWLIAFIISIYVIIEKDNLKVGFKRLLKAIFGEKKNKEVNVFLSKCDTICNRYVVYNLIDALIVGFANALFMSICGMDYTGLISFVVAITNLVPTFGPMVGLVIGGFILLMVNPMHALIFVIFTLLLQTIDGYVLKPKLFGGSLGASGLWVLVGIIVGGNMFGVVGILVAVPCVAIIILIYESYLLPKLENRFSKNN